MGKGRKSSENQNHVAKAIAETLKQEVPKEFFIREKLNFDVHKFLLVIKGKPGGQNPQVQ